MDVCSEPLGAFKVAQQCFRGIYWVRLSVSSIT